MSPVVLAACGQDSAASRQPNEASAWNDIALTAVRKGTLGPPMVARMLAMLNTAIYDAWSAFDETALATHPIGKTSVRLDNSDATTYRSEVDAAVGYAAYRILVELYPTQKADFDAQLRDRGLDPYETSQAMHHGAGVGNRAAAAVIGFRRGDGSNQLGDLAPGAYSDYTGYVARNSVDTISDPNAWQPLRFSNGKAPGFLAPHWGRVQPFALRSGDELRPSIVLPPYGSAAYKAQADRVLELTAGLDDRSKIIAEYWANGPGSETPPGHWCLFGHQIGERDRHTLADDVLLYFLLGNAMLDASIACWDIKRAYDSERPITAIRALYAGQQVPGLVSDTQGIGMMAGENWMPYQLPTFITPPFPEFTSGHSTFSAAGAEILRRFTGSDRFGGSHSAAPGSAGHQKNVPSQNVTLSWDSFSAAAAEAGQSRLYGGIHFEAADQYGQLVGRAVAAKVWAKALSLLNGTPA